MTRLCAQCDGPLTRGQKCFCSLQCAAEGFRVIRTDRCERCNKRLVKQQARFCSIRCYADTVKEQHKDEPLRAAITQLWNEGLSTAEIGRRVGISKNAVIGKAHRWELSGRPSPILPPSETPRRTFQVRLCLHAERATAGPEALPPMHPISWGAIAL